MKILDFILSYSQLSYINLISTIVRGFGFKLEKKSTSNSKFVMTDRVDRFLQSHNAFTMLS